MGRYHLYFIFQGFIAISVTVGYPQHQQHHRQVVSSDEVYQAYSPGQYILKQDASQTAKATPRLVAKNGQYVRTAGGTLKRVRVVPISQSQEVLQQNQGFYTVESPVAYAQTAAAVKVQPRPIQYQPQAIQYIQQQQIAQPQPTYYLQRAPAQPTQTYIQPKAVAKPAAASKPQYYRPQQQLVAEPEEEYPSDPNPQYNFSFDVKDDELTNYQNRQEERDNGVIKGSYSVVDPDGYVRTVTYTADSKNGFQAKVTREPTDVKVKFPVPTPAPQEQQQQYSYKKPVLRSQYPQYAQQFYKQQ